MPTANYDPTAFEQQTLELINRARLDPSGEFDALIADAATGTGVQDNITNPLAFFGVDLAAFEAQLSGLDPVAPVAWNRNLAEAAADHSQAMIDADEQAHQLPGEAALGDRVRAAGYDFSRVTENIFASAKDAVHGHAGFFIDWGGDAEDVVNGQLIADWRTTGDGIQDPPGHRNNILGAGVTEVGIGVLPEADTNTDVGPFVMTQNFGNRRDYAPQLIGVVIEDTDGDRFYDIGEGIGGITVTATNNADSATTTTLGAGGYQLELDPGAWTITFSGGALAGDITETVTIGGENVKLDAFAADAPGFNPGLSGTPGDDLLIGTAGDDVARGGAGNDAIWAGNADTGNDNFDGEGGNDIIGGGPGNDTLVGGPGFDTLFGGPGDDLIDERGTAELTLAWAGSGADTVFGSDGDDTLGGGNGDDSISAGDGNDLIYGGVDSGVDTLDGGNGSDTIFGGQGDDVIFGGGGADLIFNGPGNDAVEGGAGNDFLWGAPGDDTLFGQGGADTFAFTNTNGTDTIDFDPADNDRIQLPESFAAVTVGTNADGFATLDFGNTTVILSGIQESAVDPGWFI